MNRYLLTLATALALPVSAFSQSQMVYKVEPPALGVSSAWGESISVLSDLNGDALPDVVVRGFSWATGRMGSLHSGADGSLMGVLSVPVTQAWAGGPMVDVADFTGDGVREIVHAGPGGLSIFSGSDGSLEMQMPLPVGLSYGFYMEVLQDLTGDGVEELIVNAWLGQPTWAVVDPTTGLPVYTVASTNPAQGLTYGLAILDDFNGDGVVDFAHPLTVSGDSYMVLRSGLDGSLLATRHLPGASYLSGNGEPFVSIADVDGDGHRDLAVGGVFSGSVTLHSSASGARLADWVCSTIIDDVPCMGSRIIEVGDWNFDGHPDLMTLNNDLSAAVAVHRVVLDPLTGAILADEVSGQLQGAYSNGARIAAAEGIDPAGMAAFFELEDAVALYRNAPALGRTVCSGDGELRLAAVGSGVLGVGPTALELQGLGVSQSALVCISGAWSRSAVGTLGTCLAGPAGCTAPVWAGPDGRVCLPLDQLHTIAWAGRTWVVQAVARDVQGDRWCIRTPWR
ncbi:MAG: VCBS repeat-containing protein [Planctomycetota bacterium]